MLVKTETMDLFCDNAIGNPKQKESVLVHPDLIRNVYIDPADGKIFFEHDWYMDPFYVGTMPESIIPILTRIKFSIKKWKMVDDKIYLTISIENSTPEILKAN